jgi:hypothetical protein
VCPGAATKYSRGVHIRLERILPVFVDVHTTEPPVQQIRQVERAAVVEVRQVQGLDRRGCFPQ